MTVFILWIGHAHLNQKLQLLTADGCTLKASTILGVSVTWWFIERILMSEVSDACEHHGHTNFFCKFNNIVITA